MNEDATAAIEMLSKYDIHKLSHIIFKPQNDLFAFLQANLRCKLAIWPMFPRYDDTGILDPYKFDEDINNIWSDWKNDFNQFYIKDCFEKNHGVFDSNTAIIVDADIDIRRLEPVWDYITQNDNDPFLHAKTIIDITHWMIGYIYETMHFIFITDNDNLTQVNQFVDELRNKSYCISIIS